MKQIENIADVNAEQFIRKHISKLNNKDRMVRAMRNSIKDTIKKALETYELERVKS